MDDPLLVRLFQGFCDLGGDLESFVSGDGPSCDARGERFSRNELEDEIVRAPGLLESVDRSDVRMVERREDFRFSPESPQPLFVLDELIGQNLDRHIPAELPILRPIDLPHSAFANGLEDLVVREFVTGFE